MSYINIPPLQVFLTVTTNVSVGVIIQSSRCNDWSARCREGEIILFRLYVMTIIRENFIEDEKGMCYLCGGLIYKW